MNRILSVITILLLILTSCQKQSDDLNIEDYVHHWEISQTFMTYNKSFLNIDTINNEYEVIDGPNQILIVTIENKPIFKKNKELSDLYNTKSLLIELDPADNFVTAKKPKNSKLLRKLVAFSPDHGIKPLHLDEKITLTRKDNSVWAISSEIDDFTFNGELSFLTNQTLTSKILNY